MSNTEQERLAAFKAAVELAMKQYSCTFIPWVRKDATGKDQWGVDYVTYTEEVKAPSDDTVPTE